MKSLLVVGSLHWDIVVNAPHIPGCDETVLGHSVNYVFGGKGGNQAVAADQNGAMTYFTGRIGKDQFGKQILERLRDTSINLEGLQYGTGASGMSVAIIDNNGDYGAAVVSGENLLIDANAIIYPGDLGVLLLQNEIDEKVNIAAAKRAKGLNASVWLNAAPARPLSSDLLELVDVLIVNRVEAAVFEKQMLKTLTKRLSKLWANQGLLSTSVVKRSIARMLSV
jgi:ribokinase